MPTEDDDDDDDKDDDDVDDDVRTDVGMHACIYVCRDDAVAPAVLSYSGIGDGVVELGAHGGG